MLPLALLMVTLGWFDVAPRPATMPPPAVVMLTREQLLERRRQRRADRRQKRHHRVASGLIPYRVQNRA